MYCKNCGEILDEKSKFCPNCGNAITDSSERIRESNEIETTDVEAREAKIIPKSFFDMSQKRYCTNCGAIIGKSKTCPNCNFSRKKQYNNFCEFCGSKIENNKCTNSNVLVKISVMEKIFRVATLLIISFSFLGILIDFFNGSPLSALVILSFDAVIIAFVFRKEQIYKLKSLLNRKNINQLWIYLIYVLVITTVIGGIKLSTLTDDNLSGDDKAAYELIVEASYEFKNPSSVRLISGSVVYDSDNAEYSGWFALSATNGYGARTVGYYFVSKLDGEVFALDLEEHGTNSSLEFAKTRDELSIDKINKALDKKWGTSYND